MRRTAPQREAEAWLWRGVYDPYTPLVENDAMSLACDTTMIQRFDTLVSAIPSATLPLGMALAQIRQGTYARAIQHVRRVLAQHGTDAYSAAKARLPQWTFAGTFAPTRAKAHLKAHSGICHADIDHLDDVEGTKHRLRHDPHIVYCFTSPSGDGLKYGVRILPVESDEAYKHAWGILAQAHQDAYGITWDPSGKDICRLCFVSWDPTCYVSAEAEVYPMPPRVVIPPAPPRATTALPIPHERRERYAQRGIANATTIIAESTDGGRHEARRRASYLLGGYVGGGVLTYAEAYAALEAVVRGHTKHFGAAMKTIVTGLTKGEAKPITLEELEADWKTWKEAHPAMRMAAPEKTRPVVKLAFEPRAPMSYARLTTPNFQKAGGQ